MRVRGCEVDLELELKLESIAGILGRGAREMTPEGLHERLLRASKKVDVGVHRSFREFADFAREAFAKSAPVALGVVVARVVARLVDAYVDAFIAPSATLLAKSVKARGRIEDMTVDVFGVAYPIGVAIDATLDVGSTIFVLYVAMRAVYPRAAQRERVKRCEYCRMTIAEEAIKVRRTRDRARATRGVYRVLTPFRKVRALSQRLRRARRRRRGITVSATSSFATPLREPVRPRCRPRALSPYRSFLSYFSFPSRARAPGIPTVTSPARLHPFMYA